MLVAVEYIVRMKKKNEFTVKEVIYEMKRRGTHYKESTIQTHVTSKMCANAPVNHYDKTDDFLRISRGLYRLLNRD